MVRDNTRKAVIIFAIFLFAIAVAFIIFYSLEHSGVISNGSSQNITKVYCTSGSREGQACIQLYAPVCGYPIKQTFSNPCFACLNPSVNYYIAGDCAQP